MGGDLCDASKSKICGCSGGARFVFAAAKALYISQSTLSSAIKELEAELGTQLFLRSNRGIQPTPDGEDFLRYAREIVEQSRALERRYRHRRYAPTRFAVSTQRLPFAVRAFQRFMEQLSWNSYDIAIRECPTYTIIVTWLLEKVMWGWWPCTTSTFQHWKRPLR